MEYAKTSPLSLAAFKAAMLPGVRLRMVIAATYDAQGNRVDNPGHKALHTLREVVAARTRCLDMRMLEGPNAGRTTELEWPKAGDITFLCDARGWYGFTIDAKTKWGVQLSYHFAE